MSELGRIKTLVMGAYCWRTGGPAMYRLGWIGVDAEMNDIMWVRSSDGGMGSDNVAVLYTPPWVPYGIHGIHGIHGLSIWNPS